MNNADYYEKVVDAYLLRCRKSCDNGCYYELMRDQAQLRTDTFDSFKIDEHGSRRKKEDLERISAILGICEKNVYDFMDEISSTERTFGWPKYHEPELRKRINTALQTD
jgi:hypothetical protein